MPECTEVDTQELLTTIGTANVSRVTKEIFLQSLEHAGIFNSPRVTPFELGLAIGKAPELQKGNMMSLEHGDMLEKIHQLSKKSEKDPF